LCCEASRFESGFEHSLRAGAGSATHLFKLSRGVTPAVITGVAFSEGSQWLAASSARGTTHLFRLALSSPLVCPFIRPFACLSSFLLVLF
jgi:hypothetical protein